MLFIYNSLLRLKAERPADTTSSFYPSPRLLFRTNCADNIVFITGYNTKQQLANIDHLKSSQLWVITQRAISYLIIDTSGFLDTCMKILDLFGTVRRLLIGNEECTPSLWSINVPFGKPYGMLSVIGTSNVKQCNQNSW